MAFITKNRKFKNESGGFTVFELLVTMSVFALLSTLVMANFKSVNNSIILRNVANQVATIVRKSQIQGISVKGLGSGGAEVFPSYGVNFDLARNTSFILFADLGALPNKVFDGACPGSSECVQSYTLAKGYTIKQLCRNMKSGGGACDLASLNMTFTRPNPDATLIQNFGGATYSDAEIVLQSLAGITKTIVIWRTGQITIE